MILHPYAQHQLGTESLRYVLLEQPERDRYVVPAEEEHDYPLWGVSSNASNDYVDMFNSESHTYDKGRWIWKQIGEQPNLHLDCEALPVLAAIMLKLVGSERVSSSE